MLAEAPEQKDSDGCSVLQPAAANPPAQAETADNAAAENLGGFCVNLLFDERFERFVVATNERQLDVIRTYPNCEIVLESLASFPAESAKHAGALASCIVHGVNLSGPSVSDVYGHIQHSAPNCLTAKVVTQVTSNAGLSAFQNAVVSHDISNEGNRPEI